jgi:hypothetical protein
MTTHKKKHFIFFFLLILVLSSCSGNTSSDASHTGDTQNVIDSLVAEQDNVDFAEEPEIDIESILAEEQKEDTTNYEPTIDINVPTDDIDIDLTVLSSTVVYSEVFNMMTLSENYVGKKIRMRGTYNHFHDESTGNDYFACIIADATACCAQGIEFELLDEYAYPDDYPEDFDEITVVGVFDTYMEDDYEYCTLRSAVLE